MKTPTETAVELAIEGGWHPTYRTLPHLSKFKTDKECLLDPEFWQAIGNVKGWSPYAVCRPHGEINDDCKYAYQAEWIYKMHKFIDHLIDGNTIDEALAKILDP